MGELLGDFVGAGSVERAGESTIGEQNHAVGVRRRYRVMGDHHHRVAIPVDHLPQ